MASRREQLLLNEGVGSVGQLSADMRSGVIVDEVDGIIRRGQLVAFGIGFSEEVLEALPGHGFEFDSVVDKTDGSRHRKGHVAVVASLVMHYPPSRNSMPVESSQVSAWSRCYTQFRL